MNSDSLNLEEEIKSCEKFIEGFSSVLMATVNSDGDPESSYAPYVRYGDDYFILISELAEHTENITKSGRAGLLFIENESDSSNIFARKRVSYRCRSSRVTREDEVYDKVISIFLTKFGKIIEVLKTLQDFHLYRLHPVKGRYVAGFGKTFIIEGNRFEMVQKPENQR